MARTLDELAALSGVSRATVSRVINGGPVAEDTRRRLPRALVLTLGAGLTIAGLTDANLWPGLPMIDSMVGDHA